MITKKGEDLRKQAAKLRSDAGEYANMAKEIEREYLLITDKYMNGDTPWDVGGQQRRLERAANQAAKKAESLIKRAEKLEMKISEYER